jgi:hypothetical protein
VKCCEESLQPDCERAGKISFSGHSFAARRHRMEITAQRRKASADPEKSSKT